MVGHSGSEHINHSLTIDKIANYFKAKQVKVYVALTNGNTSFIQYLKSKFDGEYGEDFGLLLNHISLADYKKFLRQEVDVAYFRLFNKLGFLI